MVYVQPGADSVALNRVVGNDGGIGISNDNGGSYITESANGYRTPHPLYYVARDHKKSLLTWLPEAALTIPVIPALAAE